MTHREGSRKTIAGKPTDRGSLGLGKPQTDTWPLPNLAPESPGAMAEAATQGATAC